jgi:cation transport ATPase
MASVEHEAPGCRIGRAPGGLMTRYDPPILTWFASRLPASILPDHLTALGLLGALVAAVSLFGSHFEPALSWVAVAGLVASWLGNSLDDRLSRLRGTRRPQYSFFVDHLTGVASMTLIVVGLGLSPLLRLDVMCLALVGYLLLTVFALVELHVSQTMQTTRSKTVPPEMRILIAAGVVLTSFVEPPAWLTPIGRLSMFDVAALLIFGFSLARALAMFTRNAARLAKLDPRKAALPCAEENAEGTMAVEWPSAMAVVREAARA